MEIKKKMIKRIATIAGGVFVIAIGIYLLSGRTYQFYSPITTDSIINLIPTPQETRPVTLDSIFSEDHTWVKDVARDKKWTLIATGDIIPARSVNYQTVTRKDFTWAWKNITSILTQADITLINLESPLIQNCPVTHEGMVFCGDERHIEGLKEGHVTVANFANNHMGNYGGRGIEETKKLLEKNSIQSSGLGELTKVELKGIKVGFLGFDDIGPIVDPIAKADAEVIKKQIIEAKNQADLVIVSMHWGEEYTDKPSDRQIILAHLVIDSGADLIIGNHPHWIQPVELYKGKVIMYAHGNIMFDQMWSEKTKVGVIGKYTFYGRELIDVEFIPTYIKNYGQPMLLEGDEKKIILDEIRKISTVQ